MLALSVKQPWAWLIVHGYKDVENRGWELFKSFKTPQRIYLHASATPVAKKDWLNVQSTIIQYGDRELFEIGEDRRNIIRGYKSSNQLGAIIGEVDIVGCVQHSSSCWFSGPYGFELANPVSYEQPIPFKGRTFFWKPEI